MGSLEIIDQARRRVYDQAGPADDQYVRARYAAQRLVHNIRIQAFLVEDDVRFDGSAALAAFRDAVRFFHIISIIELPAAGAVIAEDRTVQLQNLFAAGFLVQAVDILRDDRLQLPRLLQLGQFPVSRVRLRVQGQHLILVETVEFFRFPHKKCMADDRLRRIVILHMIQTVLAPEIRNSALRRDARAAEKDDIIASVNNLLQFLNLCSIHTDPPSETFLILPYSAHISACESDCSSAGFRYPQPLNSACTSGFPSSVYRYPQLLIASARRMQCALSFSAIIAQPAGT